MGGPCDEMISGETAEEIAKNGKEHVHSMEDDAHKEVVADMEKKMEEDPEAMDKWNAAHQAKFDALPEA